MSNGLRFDIYERVHLPENVAAIDELEEIELVPRIQVIDQGENAVLQGQLVLNGIYRAQGAGDEQVALEHWIPVEITLPMNRVTRLDEITVDIDTFDVVLLSSRALNLTGILSLRGISLEQEEESDSWNMEAFTASHSLGEDGEYAAQDSGQFDSQQDAYAQQYGEQQEAFASQYEARYGYEAQNEQQDNGQQFVSAEQYGAQQYGEQQEAFAGQYEARYGYEEQNDEQQYEPQQFEGQDEVQLYRDQSGDAQQGQLAQNYSEFVSAANSYLHHDHTQGEQSSSELYQQEELYRAEQDNGQVSQWGQATDQSSFVQFIEQKYGAPQEPAVSEEELSYPDRQQAEQEEEQIAADSAISWHEQSALEESLEAVQQEEPERIEAQEQSSAAAVSETEQQEQWSAWEPVEAEQAEQQDEASANDEPARDEQDADQEEAHEEAVDSEQEQEEQQAPESPAAERELHIALNGKQDENETQGIRTILNSSLREQAAQQAATLQKQEEDRQQAEAAAKQTVDDDIEWQQLFLSKRPEQNEFKRIRMIIVQKNDTLEEIASRYSISPRDLLVRNNLHESAITEGQLLYIPS